MADVVISDCDAARCEGEPLNPQEHPVLDDAAAAGQQEPLSVPVDSLNDDKELEVKKKRLLEELQSALVPPIPNPKPVRPSSLALGIEVIDETALLETIPKASKNAKQSRRRAAKGAKKYTHNKTKTVTEFEEQKELTRRNSSSSSESQKKKKYSRKDMEALRFVNVSQQRKFWKALYAALPTPVSHEYHTLLAAVTATAHPLPSLPNKKPILTSAVCCENMGSELQLMDSSGNVSPVDPSCSHSIVGEDGCSILEECSEDDDSEDDYASIQRPAFLVEGKPNFDTGPPEDGWEYLRRVRWEADQIPKVKVAKLDKSRLNTEQSVYIPNIPDIAKCPEHLLPLKQWEDVFLAEFSALRENLSCLEGSSAMLSGNLQSVRSSKLPGNNFGESANVVNSDVLLYDQPTILTAEDEEKALPLENPGSKTSIDQTSSSCPTPPLLSAVLGMDPVARVSMLLKRISLLEPADTITRNDCMWLFALCATVDAPLDADTCAALRSLLRKCASIRAGKAELDEEVVMLNILATISGRYFGQSEN